MSKKPSREKHRSSMGPLLIFDKSFLQMLNPDEVSELRLHFKFVGTPLLIREIIADLKKEHLQIEYRAMWLKRLR